MIKLVAIDLDGTLLTDDKTISKRNKDVLQVAKQQGTKVVICTGRPLKAILHYLERLELMAPGDYSITFNGGLIQKNDNGEQLSAISLGLPAVHEVAEVMQELVLPLDVIRDDTVYHIESTQGMYRSIYQELNSLLRFETRRLTDFPPETEFNKMVVAIEAAYLDTKIPLIPASMQTSYAIMKSRDCLLEIMPKNVTKANGIARLAEHLGIHQSEVMAIGDEENDLSMIEYAGFGVAMANGTQIVKQAAKFVTDTNERDGVAKAIERFVLN